MPRLLRDPLVLVLSAPSGGGKTTVGQALLAANPRLIRAITCTTRAPRAGEAPGIDYHFLSTEDFARRVAAGDFIEHADVFGKRYGMLRSAILDPIREGQDVLAILDVQGAASLRRLVPQEPAIDGALVTVFFTPGSRSELEARLRGRGTDSEDSIARRLLEADQEIAQWVNFDYIVVSGSRDQDGRRLQAIYEAEGLKRARNQLDWKKE
jgi:guanylate kinase